MRLENLLIQLRGFNQPFVSYRLPESRDPVTLYGGKLQSKLPENELDYFVMAPFDVEAGFSKKILIPASKAIGFEIDADLSLFESRHIENMSNADPLVITRDMYARQANLLINKMKGRQLSKVILSRVVRMSAMSHRQAALTFVLLCETYPSAFVYYFSDGSNCHWMGASPEVLLQASGTFGKTMALAGTQSIENKTLSEISWAEKETEEQEYVTLYIRRALTLAGIQAIEETGPQSAAAGKMAHLMTVFNFQFSAPEQRGHLLQLLHPTPAVCGLPKEDALNAIRAVESHQRSYYCGYLGPVSQSGDFNLFVNLRCMQLTGSGTYLYVGGGLTARSDVQREWEETLLKASTLARVIAINS